MGRAMNSIIAKAEGKKKREKSFMIHDALRDAFVGEGKKGNIFPAGNPEPSGIPKEAETESDRRNDFPERIRGILFPCGAVT